MFKLSRQQKDHRYFCGNRYEKYSIKKLKVGAASVLIGAGFLFGYNVDTVEADSATETVVTKDADTGLSQAQGNAQAGTISEPKVDSVAGKTELAEQPKSTEEAEKPVKAAEKQTDQASTVSENANTEVTETKPSVNLSLLQAKLADLEAQIERIRGNKKQASQIQNAEKLVAEAKQYLSALDATQSGADKKAKEVSSLTSILKSIKAEETPKENKNQDSRNGKKMKEGTGFRTGVTDQALTGSIHFDTSKGPTEKQILVANNGDGERVINMAITYSASSDETVTDGKIRVTIPKAFLHSTKKPEFTNSSFVKSTDDRSTATDYVYDLNLNPMAGGSVAESLLKLYVGTSIKNAPSKGDSLPVKTEFISGGNVLSTKTATATFDYLSEIIYREKDTREKLVKNYLSQDQREYKLGSVVNGKLTPVKTPFRIPLIMTNEPFFNSGEADGWNQNGNGRLTSYDYTISGIPEFLELDPNAPNNSKWTLENGVATLHPDQTRGINQILVYAGPVLRLKEGALSTPEEIAKVIESNGTKGYNAKIVYKAVGHRPDGSSFTQTLENPDGFRIYAGDGAPSIGNMDDYINTQSNQRLFSNASNVDTFGATYTVPYHKLKADGGTLPSQYLSYLIPKDQEGNYFTRFKMYQVATNELENGNAGLKGYHAGYKDLRGQFKENFKLYGVNENNQAELIKEYMNIDELFSEITINPDKRYNHLILKTPGIVDELQDRNQPSKTIIGLTTNLDVTVGTWKEKAKDPNIQRYEDKISQVLAAENTLESAVATQRPNTGASNPAVHTKEATTLRLSMDQIGKRDLSKDNLTRGKNIPITVSYEAPDYFYLAESDKNGIKTYDLQKLDPNINKTSVMLLADPKLPLKDFRLTADNRLLSSTSIYYGGVNSEDGNWAYNRIKENYDTVNPTRIIENYKGTGKRAYIFESKDLGLSSFDLNRDGWIKGGTYKPAALTFEVENNGQIQSGTYNIESYLVWNSDAETLFGNDRSLNADYVEGHESGRTIAKANINVTMNNVIEYSTSLTISKPGTTGTRGIIDVKNGQQVILTPQIENLTDTPQKIKEAVVLIPKSEAVTYLEGPIAENSDEYDIEYTTSTAADKTTGTYVTADQITNWKDVTAVKYKFKKDYTVTKQHGFTHNFNLRVDPENQNFVKSTSQIFLKNNQNVWLESNIVGLRTEDVRGKLEVRYINNRKDDILPKISKRDFAGEPYTTTKEDLINYGNIPYLFKEIQADSVLETGTYERQVTKKVTYVYEEATFKEESKTITRTINYLEKNNESNVVANPVVQNITVTRKVYTGKETGRVVEGPWEYRTDDYQPNWPRTNSPRVPNFEAPDREFIDRVLVSQELINNGNVVENVYYEKIIPVGGDVVAKYVIEGTTTELKQETDVAKGLKVGKEYTSTAPAAGEELTATDGKVYVYKGHKTTSAAETGTVTADKQEVVYEYAPKIGGDVEVKYVIAGTEENLKDPVTLVTGRQVGSDYTATKDATITKEDGRVYKLVAANNGLKTGSAGETGKVTTEKQTVTYEYELQKGNVTVTYKDTEGNTIEGYETPKDAEKDAPTGKDFNTATDALKPAKITTASGKVYNLVPESTEGNETGKVTETPQNVTYVYKLAKGDVTVTYKDTEGNTIEGYETPKDAEKDAPTGKDFNTATDALKPAKITTASGKVYNLVPARTEGTESGKVTETPQNVTYVYKLAKGDVTVTYKDTEGNTIEGYETPKEAEKDAPTGKDFNTATEALKPAKITTASGKVYNLVPESTEGNETGKVTETPQNVTYVYKLAKGDVTVTYKDTEGNTIEGYETPKDAEKDAPTGKDFNTAIEALKPAKITTASGKVYNLVPESTEGNETGKVTETPQNVTYVYKLAKGDVTVTYKDTEGNTIEGYETPKDAEKDAPTGKDFNTATEALKPAKITTASGKVYNLVPESTEGNETGKVTETPQNVTYVYKLAKGDVTVTYKDTEGNTIEGYETPKDAEKDAPTGKDFNTATEALKPAKITTASGKVYNLVPESTEGNETGKVTETPQNVTYVYKLAKGDVTVTYKDTEGNTIEGYETPKDAEKDAPTGKDFNTATEALKPAKITTASGKVYNLVPESTEGNETGKVTETPQNVTYVYKLAKGDVTVTYKDTEGNTIEGYETPKDAEKDAPTGKDFNTATEALKPAKITTASGKVYNLVPESTEGNETGKVTETPQNVTYVYKLAKGDVTVTYKDTEGNTIEGYETPKDAEKDAPTGKDFNTATDALKPAKITTASGKVYNLVPESTEGNETGKVTETPQNVTYVYKLAKGDVTVTYKDTEGNTIEGYETPKDAEKDAPTGKDFNTATDALKPAKITTASGKVYNLVPARTEGTESGKVTETPQNVTYVYKLAKGDVTVTYKDTEGNTIEGYETPKDAEKDAPTGKDFNTATEALKPAKITTASGKVYNLVPESTEGNETGKVTETPQNVTYVYKLAKGDVTVTYKDTEGNTIEGYETPKDAEKDAPTGKDFNTATEALKPAKITTASGKVYNLVPESTEGNETGKVTETPQNVTYVYKLAKGDVTVTYKDTEGNTIEGYETPKDAEKDAPTGKDFNTATDALKPAKITTASGKVYNLVPESTEGNETGKVTETPQNVTYVYKLAKGDVTVTYKDTEGNKIPGYETPKTVETQSPTGKEYTTVTEALKPSKITTPDGKVYNLVPARTEGTESGKVTEEPQNVTYVYELAKGNVTVTYKDTEGNTIEGYETPKDAEKAAPTGKDFNTATDALKPAKITTPSGKVYNLVPESTEGNETGKVTETPQNVTYVYKLAKGDVTVTYKDTEGNTIEGYETPKDAEKDAPTGKDFNTATDALKPSKITTPSGKVYNLVPARTEGNESGKVTEEPQNVTYVYELAKGDVTVTYKDTEGNTIEGYETPKDAEKDAPTGKDFNTATEALKPAKITTASGKVYNLVPESTEGNETGKVTETPQNVTYVYKLAKGDVTVTYKDTEGNKIPGYETPKTVETQSPTGKEYTTVTEALKPSKITTPDGKVYNLVPARTEGTESGKVTEEPQNVTYVYELAKGNVTVTYKDTEGNTIEGYETPKDAEKAAPTGKDFNTATDALKPAKITTPSGKVYNLVPESTEGNETGKVTETPQNVTYVYKLAKGDVTVTYKDTEGNTIEGYETPKDAEKDAPTGKDFNTATDALKPSKITTPSGKVYNLVPARTEGNESGKVTEEPQNVTYVYELAKGDVTVTYKDTEGNKIPGYETPKTVETQSPTGKEYTTVTDALKPSKITTPDGKVYNLVPARTEGNENGKVTETPQNVTYVYELAKGNVTVTYKDTEGNTIEGYETPKDAEKDAPTGKDFNTATDALKPSKITTQDGKVYNLVPARTEGTESGKVTEEPQNVTYVYELAKGDVTVTYKDTEGNKIPGYETPKTVETQSPTGKEYTTVTEVLKPSKITTPDGKVYNLVPTRTEGTEKGKVTEEPQNVTYVYELAKGNVTVTYKDTEGNKIPGYETPKTVETQSPTGKEYTTVTEVLKPSKITTPDGKVYNLVPTRTEGTEKGKVTEEPQNVTYVYELAKGNVTVTYKDTEGNKIPGYETPKTVETQSPTGKEYTTVTEVLKPSKITTPDGKVYNLVPTRTEGTEKGKVTEEPQNVTYVYELAKGNVTVTYKDTEGNKIPGYETPKTVETQSPTGKEYTTVTEVLKPAKITTPDGKVYNLVPTRTEGTEKGKVTEEPQNVTYVYELAKGNVTVTYKDTEGNKIPGYETPKTVETQSPTGKEYTTVTEVLKPAKITTPDGKVYNLVPTRTEGTEKGKVTEEPQNVTYVYELAKGNVTVTYKDTEGNKIPGYETPKTVETQSPTGKEYTTVTEVLKPSKITTPDGKVYNLVPTRTEGTEKGKVTEEPQNVTYVYELAKGNVTVTYKDTEGNKIPGYETPKTVETQSPTGKEYTTVTEVLKPAKITTPDGKVYNLVPTRTEGTEKGKVTEEPQNVTYVYELAKGNVTVTYKDTEGNTIEGYETPKDAEKDAPTGKDFNTATEALKPSKITTPSGKVYNLVPTRTEGTEKGKVTETPQNVTYVYEVEPNKPVEPTKPTPEVKEKITSYVDEKGKEINPSDKGTKDKKDIPEYTFKETKKDKDGNTIHVYTKKSSSTPYSPTPSTPSNEESKSTVWKDTEGNILKPQEDGTKDKGTFTGYEYVKTILVGNVTTHIFKKVITPIHDETPSHSDVPGQSDIPEHSDVTATSDKSTQIANSNESTFVDGKRELPNTGTQSSTSSLLLGALAAMTGLGLVSRRRKDDKE